MTWVIGTPSTLGYGVAISDIRVKFPGGETRDCLQKVYPVGPYIVAGFSGSVLFGFSTIDFLQKVLHVPEPNQAWVPGRVAFNFYRNIRRAFAGASEKIKSIGASIMLVGVSPNVDVGIPGWARPTVAIMKSPGFGPTILKPDEVDSIGSGSGVEYYVNELRNLQRDYHLLWKLELGGSGSGGYATILLHRIQQVIEEHPEPTISHHLNVCIVQRGRIRIGNNVRQVISSDGSITETKMPKVAYSYTEFISICSEMGVEASQAAC